MKFIPKTRKHRLMLIAALALLVTVPTVAALTALFTQSTPTETTPSQMMVSNCTNLILNDTLTTTSGNLLFSCTNQAITVSGAGAFTTSTAVAYPASAIPKFSFASTSYTSAWIVTGASSCPDLSSPTGTQLTNGSMVSFSTGGESFDYCLSYSSGFNTALGTFSISWYN